MKRRSHATARSAQVSSNIPVLPDTLCGPISVVFNPRGIVTEPEFVHYGMTSGKHPISLEIYAHRLTDGWIASVVWMVSAPEPMSDGALPHRQNIRYPSRSEAVEAAVDFAIRQVYQQFGAARMSALNELRVAALRCWAKETMKAIRAADETLPLRGIRFVDLFSGAGLFALGLTQLGASCQLGGEIDASARAIYEQHIEPEQMVDDICELDGSRIETDIVLAGMVCTPFSKAGKGLGMTDPNLAGVYRHFLRLLGEIKAKVVIIECARQLLTRGAGSDLREVRAALMKAGFRVQYRTRDAVRFGVPQNRERAFIVATRIDLVSDDLLGYCFPEGAPPTSAVEDIVEHTTPGHIGSNEITFHSAQPDQRSPKQIEIGLIGGKDCQGYRVYSIRGTGATLCARSGGRARGTGAYLIGGKARGLTSREAYRMQGAPEWASPHPVETHGLRHAGNGVAVPLARALARNLSDILNRRS